MIAKQDRNGVRTPVDVQRRYKLDNTKKIPSIESKVKELEEDMEIDSNLSISSTNAVQNKVITEELGRKVSKVDGKGLSTNDYTDEEKNKVAGNTTARHTHSNKAILDTFTLTQEEMLSEYSYYIVTTKSTTSITLPEDKYSAGDIVDVYINGLKKIKDLHFSISENNIVFENAIETVGTEIEIIIKK